MRLVRVLGLVALSLTLSTAACGDKETVQPDPGPTQVQRPPDSEAIIGSWGAANSRISLQADGRYTWELIRPCGQPPCPSTKTTGTYTLQRNNLYLKDAQGNDRVLSYQIAWDPRTLTLRDPRSNEQWRMTFGQ